MDGRHMVSDQAASLSADGEEEVAQGEENSSVSFQENESGTYQVVASITMCSRPERHPAFSDIC